MDRCIVVVDDEPDVLDLVRQILEEDGMMGIPMIAMSASRSMLRAADDSHLFRQTLAKPFELSELLDAVEKYTK